MALETFGVQAMIKWENRQRKVSKMISRGTVKTRNVTLKADYKTELLKVTREKLILEKENAELKNKIKKIINLVEGL